MKPKNTRAKKTKAKTPPQKVQLSPQEQQLMMAAEAQAAQAAAELEASKAQTGRPVATFNAPVEPFNLKDDREILDQLAQDSTMPVVPQQPVQPQPQLQEQVQEQPEMQDEQPKFELSEDPVERMEQLSEFYRQNMDANFPSKDQLLQWKNMTGDIFVLDLGERVFVYRYLKRQEWIQINTSETFQTLREDQKDDEIFNRCVLYPKFQPQEIAMLPAGCVNLIVQQIQQQSMFLDPIEVSRFTIKL